LLESLDNVETIIDPKDAAESAGLRYVSDARPGIRRKKAGTGFNYIRADGSKLTEKDVLKRIKALAIPPAWTEVWICPFSDGHIQATGRDAKGRKQYRYHARFREVRESTKYEHVIAFAHALPAIREKVREHMALRGLPREKVLATVVHLLETTLIRVGNDDSAKQNNSYGLTTLKNRHVSIDGNEVRFRFTGKSGKQWSLRGQGPAHRQDHKSVPGSARTGIAPIRGRSGQFPGRHVDRCERLSHGNHRQGYHREGLSHLGGHGPRGYGPQ
jgi:DNA topoisomerase-1